MATWIIREADCAPETLTRSRGRKGEAVHDVLERQGPSRTPRQCRVRPAQDMAALWGAPFSVST